MIRIGYVKYLNTLPLVHGLDAWREAELHAAVPAKLVSMLAGDGAAAPTIDIGLVSLIDAAMSPVPLTLIPVGMIGCDGPTLTVRLFSRVPLDRVTTVHADTDSHTSVALCRVLLARRFSRNVRVADFHARERMALPPPPSGRGPGGGQTIQGLHGAAHNEQTDPKSETSQLVQAEPSTPPTPFPLPLGGGADSGEWPETILVIGDKVVTDSPPAVRYPHQMDLGEAWHEWTGLPFVYAMWMCRAADAGREEVTHAAMMLERQRLRNTPRLDWIVDRFAAERGWPTDLARTYLSSYLRFEVGAREREAVRRFLGECAALGIAPAAEVRWMEAAVEV